MTEVQTEKLSKPVLLTAELQLFVADISASTKFYTVKLGNSLEASWPPKPFTALSVVAPRFQAPA